MTSAYWKKPLIDGELADYVSAWNSPSVGDQSEVVSPSGAIVPFVRPLKRSAAAASSSGLPGCRLYLSSRTGQDGQMTVDREAAVVSTRAAVSFQRRITTNASVVRRSGGLRCDRKQNAPGQ